MNNLTNANESIKQACDESLDRLIVMTKQWVALTEGEPMQAKWLATLKTLETKKVQS